MSPDLDQVDRLLADLVAIPSMNPMGRDRPSAGYRENSLAQFVASLLKKESIDATVQEVMPGRPNVMGLVSVGAQKTVLLEAHLDTAQADTMVVDPFNPVVRGGKLFGRGSCDAKGSIAAFLQASINLLKSHSKLRYNVLLLFVSDEEYRFSGAQHAVQQGLKADFGIAGEPTRLKIVRAHKGVTRWKIETRGVAAHSAYPERGRNAIYAMSKIVDRLEEYAAALYSGAAHPLLGAPSLSVGVIEGGQAVNVVPDRCWIEIDRRTLPGETIHDILDPVRSLLHDLPDWEMQAQYLSVAGMEVAEQTAVVQSLLNAIEAVSGDAIVEGAQYATDAGIYNAAGIPTVVFGPGDISQAHTDSEFIELDQLHRAVAIIERFLTT